MHQKLLAILKPDLVRRGLEGEAMIDINEHLCDIEGFSISHVNKLQLNKQQAEKLYIEHKDKPFFPDLVKFITSGPLVVFFLEGEDIISAYREFIGATDPKKAETGTLRNKYGISIDENSFHASDSEESATREIELFCEFLGIEEDEEEFFEEEEELDEF